MPVSYTVTPEILSKFKEPFGTLIQGAASVTMKHLKAIVNEEKPPAIISVGDMVSRNLHDYNIIPQIAIIDNQTERKKLPPKSFSDKKIAHAKNPQGKITQESINAIKKAVRSKSSVQIIIDGEEDLLTLVAVQYAPENALIIYGQPSKGIVVVKVTSEKKAEAQRIWEKMEPTEEEA
ncbi:MAG: GTP-dependent dephospho-CoA kinase family protein [Candidatus Bathyarchaeota archaeon]|nr:GTP-dependent dephospho-CoA kinase family protein [Candidatus Bathyarchaeota archaeon]